MNIPDDLSPTLAWDIERAAHDIYNMSVAEWVTAKLRQACDVLADDLPAYKELIDNKP